MYVAGNSFVKTGVYRGGWGVDINHGSTETVVANNIIVGCSAGVRYATLYQCIILLAPQQQCYSHMREK